MQAALKRQDAPRPARLACHVIGYINIFKERLSFMIFHRSPEDRELQVSILAVQLLHLSPWRGEWGQMESGSLAMLRLMTHTCEVTEPCHFVVYVPYVLASWHPRI